MTTFSDWLTRKMIEKGLSDAELARRMGKNDQSQVGRFKTGERGPTIESVVQIARALGVPPEEAFRAAASLPALPESEEKLDEAVYVLRDLPPDELDEVIKIANIKRDRRKQGKQEVATKKQSSRGIPARNVSGGS